MIEIKTKKPKIAINYENPNQVMLIFIAPKNVAIAIEQLKDDKDLTLQLKEYKEKRTLSQNAYLWVLCGEIAKITDLSKEEVYRQYVKDYGVYEVLPIKNSAVDSFIYKWGKNGIGWFCEKLGKSKIQDYTNIIAYYGTSTYDTKEMSKLMDAVIRDCETIGISTLTKEQINLLESN